MYIFMMILSISVIMFLCVKYYVGRHSQNASVKYGRYQRNIVTLTQTVQFLLSYISVEVLLSLVLSVLEANKFSRQIHMQNIQCPMLKSSFSDTIRSVYNFWYLIEYFSIQFVIPLLLIMNVRRKGYFIKTPAIVRDPEFYVRPPQIQPRTSIYIISNERSLRAVRILGGQRTYKPERRVVQLPVISV